MGLGTGATAAIIGGIGAAGSIGSAVIGGSAASSAASTQANAANYAANLQAQEAQNALNFQEQVWGTQQQEAMPWITAGHGAVGTLQNLLGVPSGPGATPTNVPSLATPQGIMQSSLGTSSRPPVSAGVPSAGSAPGFPTGPSSSIAPGVADNLAPPPKSVTPIGIGLQSPASPAAVNAGTPAGAQVPGAPPGTYSLGSGSPASGSLLQGWNTPFVAPTAAQAQQYPGYQFQLEQGTQALQRSALAQGNLLTGGTGEALQQYGQGLAQSDYGNVYNQALGQYQQAYNIFQNNQANQFNRLAALSGIGQTSAGQLTSAGTSAANNASNTLLTAGSQIGQNINNAGAAQASGYIGGANAIGGGITGATSSLTGALTLQQLLNSNAASTQAQQNSNLYTGENAFPIAG